MDALPQLTGLGGYLAICAFIYKLFEKGDDLITEDTKLGLAVWILNLKAPEKIQNWPALFAHWFDKVFGEKHLSWRCFLRSCIASLAAVLLVTLVWAALRPQELRLILNGFWLAPSEFGLVQSIFLYFVVLNLLPDYFSFLETRFIIRLMARRDSFFWHAMLLVIDTVLTLLIAAGLPMVLSLLSLFISSEPISLKTYLMEVLPLTGRSMIFRSVGAPFLAICFYTSFLTSVWIWFYSVSGFLIKTLFLWERAKSKVKLEEKPLTTLGVVAIMLVTIGFLYLSVLPVCAGGSATKQTSFDDLRSSGMQISVADARKMIKGYGYYDLNLNLRGQGIKNDFELLPGGSPGDSIVYDATTHLHWQRSGSADYVTYERAQTYVDSLNTAVYAGYADWRLPTLEEAMSLLEPTRNEYGLFIDPVFDGQQTWIWTADKETTSRAWVVGFISGACRGAVATSSATVACVRYAEGNHRSFIPMSPSERHRARRGKNQE